MHADGVYGRRLARAFPHALHAFATVHCAALPTAGQSSDCVKARAEFGSDLWSPPAVGGLITLIFLMICLDGPKTAVVASPATMALVPRFLTRRTFDAFKLRLLVSDMGLEQQVAQMLDSDAVVREGVIFQRSERRPSEAEVVTTEFIQWGNS